jgi:hypothetical protein
MKSMPVIEGKVLLAIIYVGHVYVCTAQQRK